MRFAFTDDQRALQAAVRDLLDKECAAEHVRAAWDADTGRSPERWRALAAMGVVGLTAPAEHGGLGMDELDLVLLLEESGRACLPEPLLETTAVAIPLLRDHADPATAARWLPVLASGDAIATVALRDEHVPDAHIADVLILQRETDLHLVPRDAVSLVAQPSADRARRLFSVAWQPVPSTVLARGGEAIAHVRTRGALAAAAQLLGIGQRAIDLAAAYAKERRQFGVPIGSFQAVKHRLADALLHVEFARPVVYRAAHSVARAMPDAARDASMAKAVASDAASTACKAALQVHGAIGYTKEHDLHLWLARCWALANAWGTAAEHRARVAGAVLG